MRTWLIDTGPFVAYLDRRDPFHKPVVSTLGQFTGQLVTTGAVVTEAMHLVAEAPKGPMALAEFVRSAEVRVFESTRSEQLLQAAALMQKYADTPMDFADATLVRLADQLDIVEILTLDRRGFSTYRTAKGKRFVWVL